MEKLLRAIEGGKNNILLVFYDDTHWDPGPSARDPADYDGSGALGVPS